MCLFQTLFQQQLKSRVAPAQNCLCYALSLSFSRSLSPSLFHSLPPAPSLSPILSLSLCPSLSLSLLCLYLPLLLLLPTVLSHTVHRLNRGGLAEFSTQSNVN